jgi:tRNA A37 threonylcarbamoyladenosine synthetase subunit TsaC/SUA5/YrdC
MAQYFEVHPDNPQPRLLKQAAALLEQGGIVAVPTDSSYALACHLDDKAAADRLRQIRGVDNKQYRLLKSATPGPYTFILEATREVPRRVSHPQRKTIGLRVPGHRVLQELLALHRAPLLATTLIPPHETEAMNDAQEIRRRFEKQVAGVIDSGACPSEPTTVIDLTPMGTGQEAVVVRVGRGELGPLGL